MNKSLSFNDVLLVPKFSHVKSRKDVILTQELFGMTFNSPIISSNMDTITEVNMAVAMSNNGAIGCLHRFNDVVTNVSMYREVAQKTNNHVMASFGLGYKELERANELVKSGCKILVLDVAHGASMEVVRQVKKLRKLAGNEFKLIVGNFATGKTIREFRHHCGEEDLVDGWKIGVGSGGMCLTQRVTGFGMPTLASIIDCRQVTDLPLIADGGMKTSGDVVKAIAAGANLVMLGGMLAGTDESPGEEVLQYTGYRDQNKDGLECRVTHKKYRGSASLESYEVQGKVSDWRSPEGESTLVPYKGPVANVIKQIEGGLRSALSYCGVSQLNQLTSAAEFVNITTNGYVESGAHGKHN